MKEAGDIRVDAVPLGTTEGTGTVRAAAGGRLCVRTRGRVEVHDREAYLAGVREPVGAYEPPPGARAEPAPDGGFVVAGPSYVRAVAADGTVRWELGHDTWHGSHRPPRAPGAPAASPCGRFVAATVPTPLDTEEVARRAAPPHDGPPRRGYGQDRLLLLDAVTGDVRAEQPVAAVSGSLSLRWQEDGRLLGASFWTAWYGWASYWMEPSEHGLRIVGGGPDRHELAGFVPRSSRLVTMCRAEHMSLDDDRYELALHDTADAHPTAVLDLNELSWDAENDDFGHAYPLDEAHVLVTADWVPRHGPMERTHWLLASGSLRPLGRLRYPHPVMEAVTALGDGTWLTRDGDRLHHWGLAGPAGPREGAPRPGAPDADADGGPSPARRAASGPGPSPE
ncbi:hypothetical protein [Streptomyces gobitricini]|uniref:Uncharacterized protein n=1 Tax=Streptomyces gobitricini TaxID=68211 RepID=A0ABN3MEK9_9ACTN